MMDLMNCVRKIMGSMMAQRILDYGTGGKRFPFTEMGRLLELEV